MDAELEFHVEMQTRRFVAAGMTPEDARREAIARLGNLGPVRDACRAIGVEGDTRMRPLAAIRQDFRDAWRGVRRAPLFAATAVVTLALGIGAATAMFSVFHAVLLGALPYRHAPRMVMIWNSYGPSLPQAAIAPPEFADFLDAPGRFDQLAAVRPQQVSLGGPCGGGQATCDPERINAYYVSPNLFELAGTAPALGRPFTAADGVAGAGDVVLLSHALWQRRYGGDAGITGRAISLGGTPATVIGVMPPGVRFPDEPLGFLRERADLWVAYRWERNRGDGRGNQNLALVARLEEGATMDDAWREVDRMADRFRQAFPGRYAEEGLTWRLVVVPLREQMVGDVRAALVVLFAAVGLVLLIACANVAGLLMTRGATRARELAVRAALGAGRRRLAGQLLTEAALIAAAGAVAGLVLARAGMILLVRLDAGRIPRLGEAALDWRVLAFALLVTAATTVLVGLLPALRQSRVGPRASLADEGVRGVGPAPVRAGLRRALVVGEVALAVVVLVGAGLLARSFVALQAAPTGVDPDGVVTFEISPPRDPYLPGAPVAALHERIAAAVAALPGVERAATIYPLPMGGERWGGTFNIDGRPVPEGQPDPHAEIAAASPGYFAAAGIRLIDGREFEPSDRLGAPPVVIVDEQLARQYWPGERAVGKRIDTDGRLDPAVATVVGVVAHVRNGGPRDDGEPQLYLPEGQFPNRTVAYVVRTGDAASAIAGVRAAVRSVDPDLPIARLGLMTDVVARVFARDRFNALLLAVFAAVALLLAVVGLYGVLSQLVAERARDIGIRLALGGRPVHIARRVVGEALVLAGAGAVLGLAAAAMLSRGLDSLLFGVPSTDPVTYVAIAALLLVTAAAASLVPVRRAVSVDPVAVLR